MIIKKKPGINYPQCSSVMKHLSWYGSSFTSLSMLFISCSLYWINWSYWYKNSTQHLVLYLQRYFKQIHTIYKYKYIWKLSHRDKYFFPTVVGLCIKIQYIHKNSMRAQYSFINYFYVKQFSKFSPWW